ncbi:MAG: AmmeMemoRadiSam system protein A [Leptospiraceae bacterium]|nr:AmmeMemoRadiSam system protein A [Leptospiraceae bacterium]MDW7976157.1 AmmeMemoRadiSam system protein A [Leptospiraceae bacterium]
MLTEEEKKILKSIARKSIEYGLIHHKPPKITLENLPKKLHEKKASFVTITLKNLPKEKNLRGCIGSIFPNEPLAMNVSYNAFSAAFKDHRFPPLTEKEFPYVDIKISVLSPLEKISCVSFDDLLSKIRPHVDGIYLKSPDGRATYLPDVWNKIEDKKEFIYHLYKKAELSQNYPFSKIEWFRYTTENF